MIRPAGPQDVPFLRDMLRHAYYWRVDRVSESGEPPVRATSSAGAGRATRR